MWGINSEMATVGELKARGYKEGSIVRVHMHNFISYDDAVVYPGPKLNIILGPNGTKRVPLAPSPLFSHRWRLRDGKICIDSRHLLDMRWLHQISREI